MWEVFLKKYSSLDENLERLVDLEKKVRPYTSFHNFKDNGSDEVIRQFLGEDF